MRKARLDFEQTLSAMLGLMGQEVRVELSGPEHENRAGAGFSGTLIHGKEDTITRIVDEEEALNFAVAATAEDDEPYGWIVVGRSLFEITVVLEGISTAMTIRAGGMYIVITPADASSLEPLLA